MIIKNFDALSSSTQKNQALLIAEAGLSAIKTSVAVKNNFFYDSKTKVLKVGGRSFEVKNFRRVICIGFGKAALEAVTEIQSQLKDLISCGFVLDLQEGNLSGITCRVGTHPYPTMVNVAATQELLVMLQNLAPEDLVICVVSGGGSSLLCYPHEISCESEVSLLNSLTKQGANITEINTVRKHISKIKGGNLAKMCYPATMINLIFSDVPGDDLSTVASGPTVKDTTYMRDAAAILKKYNTLELCSMPACKLVETPKEDKYFEKVYNFLTVSSKTALSAMEQKARDLGLSVSVFSDKYEGKASEVGRQILSWGRTHGKCTLAAGESTVEIKGGGKGGRNQEMSLSVLPQLKSGEAFLTLASDGYDNTPFAGAVVDSDSLLRARGLGLNPELFLEQNDSYSFFKQLGDGLETGLTGSNISDLVIYIRK